MLSQEQKQKQDGALGVPDLLKMLEVAHRRLQDENHQLCAQVGDLTLQLNEMEESLTKRLEEPLTTGTRRSYRGGPWTRQKTPPPSRSDNVATGSGVHGVSLDPMDEMDQQLGLEAAGRSTGTSEPNRQVMYGPGNDNNWKTFHEEPASDPVHTVSVQDMDPEVVVKVSDLEAEICKTPTKSYRRGASFLGNGTKDASNFYIGAWVDRDRRQFYGGKKILIGETEWMPLANAHRPHISYEVQPARMSRQDSMLKSNQQEVCLCEIHSDGTTREYFAQRGTGATLIITSENAPEVRYVLDRHKGETRDAPSKRLTTANDVVYLSRALTTQKVDLPKDLWARFRFRLDKVLRSSIFDYSMGTIIVLNSICLGMSSELSLPGDSSATSQKTMEILDYFESAFLIIYVFESMANLAARGRSCFRDPWFIFDFTLVVIGAAYQWCISLLVPADDDSSSGSVLEQILVLRTLRLLRLLRAMRMLPMLKVVWRLTYGLLTSANTMLSTLALIILILYMFACLGLEIITKRAEIRENERLLILVDENFKNLYTTMITLLQFVTLDSVAGIYGPFVQEFPWLLLYFFPILLVVSISLMNMVTAVLVEGALAQANNDRDVRNRTLLKKVKSHTHIFKQFFQELDKDSSHSISVSELENLDISNLPPESQQAMEEFKFETMVELFEMLDGDTSGSINEEEFVNGLINLSLSDHQVPPEVIIILKLSRSLTRRSNDVTSQLAEVRSDIHQLFMEMSRRFSARHHRHGDESSVHFREI